MNGTDHKTCQDRFLVLTENYLLLDQVSFFFPYGMPDGKFETIFLSYIFSTAKDILDTFHVS